MSNSIPIIITVTDKDAISKIGNVKRAIDDLKNSAGAAGARVQNSFTQAFTQVNATATKVQAAYSNSFNRITNVTIKTTNNMRQAFDRANRDIEQSTKGMVGRVLNYLGKMRTSMSSAMKSFNQQDTAPRIFTSLTGSASILGGTITAMAALGKEAYTLSNAFFAAENGLKAITGSGEAAKESMEFVRSEADRLGQDVLTLSKSYTRLAAAGSKSALTTQQVRDVFSSLSETATILQFDAQKTEGSFRALTQMLSKGKVQAEELRGQLGEHLPGAFEIAAEAMGVTTAQLDDMLKKGKVSAVELLTNLPEALRKAYGEGLPGALARSSVQIGRMKNELKEFGADMGTALEPATAALANLGRSIISLFNDDEFKGAAGSLAKSFADAVNYMAGGLDLVKIHAVKTAFDVMEIWDNIKYTALIAFKLLAGGVETILWGMVDGVGLVAVGILAAFQGAINTVKELWAGLLDKIAAGASMMGQDDFAKSMRDKAKAIRTDITPAMDEFIAKAKEMAKTGVAVTTAKDTAGGAAALKAEWDERRRISDLAEAQYEKEAFMTKDRIKLNAALSDANKDFNKQTAAELEAQEAALDRKDKMMKDGIKLAEQLRTPQEAYNDTLKELNEMLSIGAINQETFNRATAKAAEDYKTSLEKMSEATNKFNKEVEDTNKKLQSMKESNATPYEKMQMELAELNKLEQESIDLRRRGGNVLMDEQTIMRQRLAIQDEYHQKLIQMNEAFDWDGWMQKGLEGTADILTEYLVDPFNTSAEDIKKKFSDMLKSMAGELLKNAALQMFNKMFNTNGTQGAGVPQGPLDTIKGMLGLGGGQTRQGGGAATGAVGAVAGLLGGGAKGQCNTECATQAGGVIQQAMTTGATNTGAQINTAMTSSGTTFTSMFQNAGTGLWSNLKGIFSSAQGGFKSVFDSVTSSLGGLFSKLPQMLGGLFGGGGGGGGAGAAGGIASAIGGAAGGAGGGWGAAAAAVISMFAANGKVMEGGRVKAFADGGVVNGPTRFPLASGNMGLMGEAGPEAIMPLTRDSSGKLGVSSGGAGAQPITIINLLDEKLLEGYLSSDKAGKVIMNHLSKNSGQVKGIARG